MVKRCGVHPEGGILDRLLGELDGPARAAVESHLQGCKPCQDLDREWREVLASAAAAEHGASGGSSRGGPRWTRVGAVASRFRPPLATLAAPTHAGLTTAAGVLRARGHGMAEMTVRGLPPLPIGQVYVLWRVRDGGWQNIGAFAVDAGGMGRLAVDAADVCQGDGLCVTAEAHANERAPIGAVHLAGRRA